MRFLVCGGRLYNDWNELYDILNAYVGYENDVIIHGRAQGADQMAGEWALRKNIPTEEYPADWTKYGKSAGYIRNKQMLDEGKPDYVIAFPGGKGTAMMIRLAKEAGVEVIEIDRENS